MRRTLLAVLLALVVPQVVSADSWSRWLRAELDQEEKLLTADLGRHAKLRDRETHEAVRASDAASRLDQSLRASAAPDLVELRGLESALAAARASQGAVAEEARSLRQQVYERLRRIEWLTELWERARRETSLADDRVTGLWTITILPSGQSGRFDLRLDGTLVSGSYRLDQGAFGSLRGTLVGNVLTLERIDSQRGPDVVYEGQLDAAGVEVRGSWRSSLVSNGGPAGGSWVGRRVSTKVGEEIESR